MTDLTFHAPILTPLWIAEVTDEDGARVLVLNCQDDMVFELPGGITPQTQMWARHIVTLFNEDFTGRKMQ